MVVKLILSALLGFILCLLLIAVLANLKFKNKKNKLSAYRSRDMATRNSEKNKK